MITQGASGFFSRPQLMLDPQLFEGKELHPHVRQTILDLFYNHMDTMFHNPRDWSMLWLAGSGISYQWSADRGNGDLDVLFGLDYSKFVSDNPEYGYYTREEIADAMDTMLKKHLWPKTARTMFRPNETSYEITYYLNPLVEDYDESIELIHPYASFNLTENHWTIEPPMISDDPNSMYPVEYEEQAQRNLQQATQLVERFKVLSGQLASTMPGSPLYRNLEASMTLLRQHVRNMFDNIHLGRKNAFSQHGGGYGDFYNYQWQAAKRDGIINAFNEILNGE